MSRPRGFVVVTGSELVRGDRTDLNGPFLAQELLRLGLEPARIAIVGDDPAELEAALREGLEADICLVTGGLGPTHDDRTVEVVANTKGFVRANFNWFGLAPDDSPLVLRDVGSNEIYALDLDAP